MKIALDFDGVCVDVCESKFIDKKRLKKFLKSNIFEVHIVTARPEINLGYIKRKIKFANIPIYCLGSNEDKITFINAHSYDVVIDDNIDILENVSCDYKILFESWEQVLGIFVKPKLFSPGPVLKDSRVVIDMHHRSSEFSKIVKQKSDLIRDRFFNSDYDILFTQGSGTSAIESAVTNFFVGKVLILNNGVFSQRICKILTSHNIVYDEVSTVEECYELLLGNSYQTFIGVLFETSKSKFNDLYELIFLCSRKGVRTIVDMVSALGFYDVPNADVIASSTSKIIGSLPVMGLLGFKHSIKPKSHGYYLDVTRYIESMLEGQTPNTTLMPQVFSISEDSIYPKCDIERNCRVFESLKHRLV